MTSFRVQLPEKFDLSRQEEWPKWSRRFERFRQASGLVKEAEDESNKHADLRYGRSSRRYSKLLQAECYTTEAVPHR